MFHRLRESDQSAAQRHAFFAEREVAKIPDVPKDTPARPIAAAGVVGCGTMGGGIAMSIANAGLPVTVLESSQEALDRGMAIIRKNYAATVSKGRLSQAQMDARLARMTPTLDDADLGGADVVIEAVFEELPLKKEVFARLDRVCKPEAILATNTSTLDVDAIAAATSRPEQVIGTHFFSPANVMKLMENVRGARTSPETIATVMKLSKKLGKVGVLVGVCDGFVGNRMLYAYRRQADFLLEEGALPEQIDRVIYDFGLPMGPYQMADLAGLDVSWRVRKAQAPTRPAHLRYSPIADRICEQGRYGQKTGAGWYRYKESSRVPIPDAAIHELIAGVSAELGITRRTIDDDEIVPRCLYPLVNEGAKILDEGLALRASDIDVIWMHGYGFPRYRGGPMFWADLVGLRTIPRHHEPAARRARRVARAGAAAEAARRAGQGLQGLLRHDRFRNRRRERGTRRRDQGDRGPDRVLLRAGLDGRSAGGPRRRRIRWPRWSTRSAASPTIWKPASRPAGAISRGECSPSTSCSPAAGRSTRRSCGRPCWRSRAAPSTSTACRRPPTWPRRCSW